MKWLIVAATALLFACSGNSEPVEPSPTPDDPRLTRAEAKAAFDAAYRGDPQPAITSGGSDRRTVRPLPVARPKAPCAMPTYRGEGIWECGHARLDERTGVIWGGVSASD